MRLRTYSELRYLPTINERFRYLRLSGAVGDETFGTERYLNQEFYRSRLWRQARDIVIARDLGCDLGVEGYEIHDRVYVHHMNPIRIDDIVEFNDDILNPDYLITVTHRTHNGIHYGDESALPPPLIERRPGDTVPWR